MKYPLKVLFVCVANSCRSQMAEGFAHFYGKGVIEPYSAGSKPSGTVDARAVTVMREVNIDISSQHSKGFGDLGVKDFDIAISLGCGDICPFVPAAEHLQWDIEDPKGKDLTVFRLVRWQIWRQVTQLIGRLNDKP